MSSSSRKSSTPLEKSDREASQLAWPVPLLSYRRVAECAGLKGSHRWAATDVKAGRVCCQVILEGLPFVIVLPTSFFPACRDFCSTFFLPSFPRLPHCFPPKSSEFIVDALLSLCNPLMIKGSFLTNCAFQRRYFWSSKSRSVTENTLPWELINT